MVLFMRTLNFFILLGLSYSLYSQAAGNACESLFRNKLSKSPSELKVSTDVNDYLQIIDQTAVQLQGTKKFTSPREWRKKTAKSGLPAVDLPTEFGGANLSAKDTAAVFARAGYYDLDLRDVVGGAHVRPLLQSSEPEVRNIVQQVAEGKAYMAISITEKEAGSNMRAMNSISVPTDGGYFLTGEKMYNGRFTTATHVILFTQASGQNGKKGKLNAFVLPKDYPGLQYVQIEAHGLKGNSFGGVSFDKMFVPEKYRLGGDGDGGKVFRNHFLYWRLMMSATAIGTAKGAIAQVVERMRNRTAFGKPIGSFTHLQQQLAEHTAKIKMAELLVDHAASLIDSGDYQGASVYVAMAKAEGVEIALAAADFAMKTFGAEGYSTQVDLGKRVHDLQGLRIADGTTDVLRSDVVRQTYGDDFWQMAFGEP